MDGVDSIDVDLSGSQPSYLKSEFGIVSETLRYVRTLTRSDCGAVFPARWTLVVPSVCPAAVGQLAVDAWIAAAGATRAAVIVDADVRRAETAGTSGFRHASWTLRIDPT